MTLVPGRRLGPYEIVGTLGVGGMGEVYRARDPRLDRTIALKILPPHLRHSPDLRARFEREARTISQLTHPHICTLYDIGREDDVDFLVMEHLEGETLAARLARGAVPLEQVLQIGAEIASALEHAHRHGIVHRDLKPANVMLTRTGSKLLDFGLAKLRAVGVGENSVQTGSIGDTAEGTLLGTLSYMAPEQLECREVDARSDIWALGCVLYELVTGTQAFRGESQASVIAAILEREPAPITSIQSLAPPLLDQVVRACLAKDREERWQSAADVKRVLRGMTPGPETTMAALPMATGRPQRPRRLRVAAVGLLLLAGAATTVPLMRRPDVQMPRTLTVLPPPGAELTNTIALSPDGRYLVMTGQRADDTGGLWLRRLDTLNPQLLPQTDGAEYPFWSPDSRSIGFFARGQLKRLEVSGGPPQALAAVVSPRGGTWNRDGVIVFGVGGGGLYRTSANGGTTERLTTLAAGQQETGHRWPVFMTDGRHVLFMVRSNRLDRRFTIAVTSLDDPPSVKELTSAESGAMYSDGQLLFVRGTTLFAQQFDTRRLELTGSPTSLLEDVWRNTGLEGLVGCTNSLTGTIACRTGGANLRLAWVDRSGRELGFFGPSQAGSPAFSRDGRLIVATHDTSRLRDNLWVLERGRDAAWQLTRPELNVLGPVWSPDGRQVVFASEERGRFDLYVQAVERSSVERPLLRNDTWWKVPTGWSSDGRWILYEQDGDVWRIPGGGGTPEAVLRTPAAESGARLSPDTRWLAYESDESGRDEVYLTAFPGPADPILISTSGGTQAAWRSDGRELFYVAADRSLMVVEVDTSRASPMRGAPAVVLSKRVQRTGYEWDYALAPTGDRFLVSTVVNSAGLGTVTIIER